ncbi:hypothetical protein EVAR_15769_1 [Eumeta japonica]|uniref:Uncharacterized protein n=1 Tax=Eumeta variegata TaxID=151549 RepID=A0A4C1TZA9_EUMVA|nr:hypothetical protein EVAR_15769_1 [Eumeta japonica]
MGHTVLMSGAERDGFGNVAKLLPPTSRAPLPLEYLYLWTIHSFHPRKVNVGYLEAQTLVRKCIAYHSESSLSPQFFFAKIHLPALPTADVSSQMIVQGQI